MIRQQRLVNVVYEDEVSLSLMERIIGSATGGLAIDRHYPAHGYGKIRAKIKSYNAAARYMPFFILTDLDMNDCAPGLIREWLGGAPSPGLIFRVAVREAESWILADTKGFSRFLSVSEALLPSEPDLLPDPKAALLKLAARARKRVIRDALLPHEFARQGPDYNGTLQAFIRREWNLSAARRRSPSFDAAVAALERSALSK